MSTAASTYSCGHTVNQERDLKAARYSVRDRFWYEIIDSPAQAAPVAFEDARPSPTVKRARRSWSWWPFKRR